MRVLIGNIDPDLSQLLAAVLKAEDSTIEVVTAETLDLIGDDADLYLLVLNNIGPYDCDPAERVERVLLRAQELHAPVIAMAGWPDDAAARAYAAGIRHFFWLPFDVESLIGAVREVRASGPAA